ncbi:MAG: hypothetical protein QM820_52050 [Minicystis sp.]
MPSDFLGLSSADVAARLSAIASAAAAGPVDIHLGDDVFGCRNIGVDLPRQRRSATATRLLRQRVRDALERAGVVLAESALAPKVAGDIRGSVRVREITPTYGDAAHMLRPPRA